MSKATIDRRSVLVDQTVGELVLVQEIMAEFVGERIIHGVVEDHGSVSRRNGRSRYAAQDTAVAIHP